MLVSKCRNADVLPIYFSNDPFLIHRATWLRLHMCNGECPFVVMKTYGHMESLYDFFQFLVKYCLFLFLWATNPVSVCPLVELKSHRRPMRTGRANGPRQGPQLGNRGPRLAHRWLHPVRFVRNPGYTPSGPRKGPKTLCFCVKSVLGWTLARTGANRVTPLPVRAKIPRATAWPTPFWTASSSAPRLGPPHFWTHREIFERMRTPFLNMELHFNAHRFLISQRSVLIFQRRILIFQRRILIFERSILIFKRRFLILKRI